VKLKHPQTPLTTSEEVSPAALHLRNVIGLVRQWRCVHKMVHADSLSRMIFRAAHRDNNNIDEENPSSVPCTTEPKAGVKLGAVAPV
jgi:hypothetical protein